jgi:hypothetical protein
MSKAIFLFFIILFAYSERVFAIQFGEYKVGLFDISALIYVLVSIMLKLKLSKNILYLIFVLAVIQILALVNSNSISYTASFTVGLKLFLTYFLFREQINSLSLLITGLNLYIFFTIVLVAFSDGAIFFPTEYFNRNETLGYLLMSVFIIDEKYNTIRILLLLVLVCLTFVVESRQILVSMVIVSFFTVFFSRRISISYKIFGGLFAVVFILIVIPVIYSGYDDYTLRRYNIFYEAIELDFESITESKDVTQGDKYRILNIISGFQGWLRSPFFGHGLGSYVRLNEFGKVAHNTYVTILFEGGLVLFSVFIYLIYYFSRHLNHYLNFLIFFTMLVSLNFIESLGKLPIYIFFGIVLMKINRNYNSIKYVH